MKTPKEIKEFLDEKTFNQEDTRTIRAIIKSKNYEGINVINGGVPNCKLIDFINWFESGELIPNEFYYCECTNEEGDYYSFVFQKNNNLKEKTEAYHILNLIIDWYDEGELSVCDDKDIINLRLATPAQKQQLIDRVQEETDKIFNEETKTFEDKPKDILVPSNIHIIKNDNRQQLGIGFNEYKQVVFFDKEANVYQVLPITKHDYLQQCKLVLCRHEDIEVGDILTTSYALLNNLLTDLDAYLIKSSEEDICFIEDSDCVIATNFAFEEYVEQKIDFYKLVEVDKK